MAEDSLPREQARREAAKARYARDRERFIELAEDYRRKRFAADPDGERAVRAAQMRRWREANPDKVAAKNVERNLARQRDLEAERAAERARYAANPDQYRAKSKRNRAPTEVRSQQHREWRAANPDKAAANDRNKRARRRNAEGTHTAEDIADIRRMQRDRCAYCRKPLHGGGTVDHIKAVVRGGSNERRNLQLACNRCNSSKHDSDPIEFMQGKGRLL